MQFSAGRVGMLLLGVVWFVPVLLALLGLVERACVCMADAPNRPAASCDGLSHGSGS